MHYTGCYQIYVLSTYSTIEVHVFTHDPCIQLSKYLHASYPCILLSEYLHIIHVFNYQSIYIFTYLFNCRTIDGCLPAPDRQKLLVASVAAFWTCVSDDRRSSTRGLPSATVRSVLPEERGECMMMNISDLESS